MVFISIFLTFCISSSVSIEEKCKFICIDVVYRDTDDAYEEDIYLDEFKDEIEEWIIDALKDMGCVTAKAVLNTSREDLINKADLEEETVDNVLAILRAEFEDESEAQQPAPAKEAPAEPAGEDAPQA